MTNKIVIDTAALKALFDRHPQVEIELLAVAREKVAEELKRKLPDGYATKMADDMMTDFKKRINESCLGWRGGTLSDTVQKIVIQYVNETCVTQAKKLAEDTVKTAVDAAIEAACARMEHRLIQHQDALLQKINGFIGKEISDQIQSRLDAMARLTTGLGG